MENMKRTIELIALVIVFFTSCTTDSKRYKIGISQCSDDIWREKQNTELKIGGFFHKNVELRFAAAYDSDETLYSNALSRLDAIYTELGSMKGSISSNTQAKLTAADFINKGDIDKWQRYCNSLMLRLGIHVAAQGSLASAGKSAVSKIKGKTFERNKFVPER